MFEEELEMFKLCAKSMNEWNFDEQDIQRTLKFILNIETDLWRARIRIQRKLNERK